MIIGKSDAQYKIEHLILSKNLMTLGNDSKCE
jgi:hypothetical protein